MNKGQCILRENYLAVLVDAARRSALRSGGDLFHWMLRALRLGRRLGTNWGGRSGSEHVEFVLCAPDQNLVELGVSHEPGSRKLALVMRRHHSTSPSIGWRIAIRDTMLTWNPRSLASRHVVEVDVGVHADGCKGGASEHPPRFRQDDGACRQRICRSCTTIAEMRAHGFGE